MNECTIAWTNRIRFMRCACFEMESFRFLWSVCTGLSWKKTAFVFLQVYSLSRTRSVSRIQKIRFWKTNWRCQQKSEFFLRFVMNEIFSQYRVVSFWILKRYWMWFLRMVPNLISNWTNISNNYHCDKPKLNIATWMSLNYVQILHD